MFCATERGKRVIEQTNAPSETGTMRQVMNLLRHSGMRVTSIYLGRLLEQDISEMVETLNSLFAGEPVQDIVDAGRPR